MPHKRPTPPRPHVSATWRLPPSCLRDFDISPSAAHRLAPLRGGRLSRAQEAELARAEILFCLLSDRIDAKVLSHAPKLRILANLAAGTNHIDLDECERRGILVLNTPDVLTDATAELTLALLLAVARRLGEGERICRKNAFPGWQPDYLLGLGLRGRHALIVGQGRIGRAVAQRFKVLGIRCSFITRTDSESQIREKLKDAQILTFHCPLTPQTHHWLSAERIRLLPTDAIVLNTARGPVVDEPALVQALRKKRIFGAAFDVYCTEPKIPLALRKLPNAFLCPHLGSATQETRQAMLELLLGGIRDALRGKKPKNQVLPPRSLLSRRSSRGSR